MSMLLTAVAAVLFIAIGGSLFRVVRGPTLWDRLAGVALIGTKTLILLVVAGELSGQPEMFTDIALAYATIGFLGALVIAKYFEGSSSKS
ncbi:MAG: hypothetical protein F4228_05105 [Acidobacteria bacterium]|nr:monovalent cation/H+ antiporter complex subunit F [Acidobacteriota bacterium]MDE2660610.1 monovalent cation/H+ antiporter complex subunit F [Acidobacteriota bacterium]MDE2711624.1 monovalent cation/H+ antiporter complex subunit F [Acidobacteriota bacterium]MXW38516.1 hypothetical protein [Acidobacteriota bacterium]MXW71424.1 hypothetical protein [Acidobacteriota bacterium]